MNNFRNIAVASLFGLLIVSSTAVKHAVAQKIDVQHASDARLIDMLAPPKGKPDVYSVKVKIKIAKELRDRMWRARQQAYDALNQKDPKKFSHARARIVRVERLLDQRLRNNPKNAGWIDAVGRAVDRILEHALPNDYVPGWAYTKEDGTEVVDPDPKMRALLRAHDPGGTENAAGGDAGAD